MTGREDLRAELVAGAARADERVAALTADHERIVAASAQSNADDEHDPEGATIAFEREQVSALLVAARGAAARAREALARLDSGDYGTCGRCGRPIDPARLQARPDATTCIDCARAASARRPR